MQRLERTVLIIDDEAADRLVYRRYLTDDPIYQYTVLEAEHGNQALAICRATTPDCILLDYRLPQSDGLTVLQTLTAAAHPHRYPVVMLTGAENTAIAVQALQSGVHDYLGKNQVTPAQLQRANGIGKLYLDATGRPIRLLGTVQDITPLKKAEEVLQAINATLTARVRERTAALEESKQQLEHFVNIATRDLRDTLRGIAHLAGWLSEDAEHLLPSPSQEHLRNLGRRVRRLNAQLEDLLAYARAGRQDDALRRVDTQVLVETIAQGLDLPQGFRLTIETPMPTFVTQSAALETVLRHLMENAVKHHHQLSQGHLHVAVKQQGDWLEFIVKISVDR